MIVDGVTMKMMGGVCKAGLCARCCHSSPCWINHTHTSSKDEADQLDVNADQVDANAGADVAAQIPIPPKQRQRMHS